MFFAILGVLIFISIFIFYLYFNNISFNDFFTQYILFPRSLGETRLDWVFPLEFQRFVLRFKIHYLSIIVLIYITVNSFFVKEQKLKIENILIILCLIFSCILFIFHQLMTINAIFIYCLIPIFLLFPTFTLMLFYKKNT